MDCIDCHNRPSHVYRLPEDEVDAALAEGRISRTLPYVRREAIRVLRNPYTTLEEAREGIALQLAAFYEAQDPAFASAQRPAIEQAATELTRLWSYNVFPEMKVDWGTYPNHIGHEMSDGCFRCHNDEHQTADG